jgi:hypothetical protein
MTIYAFCMVGLHPGPKVGDSPFDELPVPTGWRMLPASQVKTPAGEYVWVYDPDAKAKIMVCPACVLPGEPRCN